MDEKRSLVVDIDGTLCPIKKPDQEYKDLVPFQPVIDRLREYQNLGFEIVLYTARNMRTHSEKLGRINKHTAPVLIDWLDRWDIPYDEILFGKPWPGKRGFYLDDRTIRLDEFLSMTEFEIEERLQESRDQASEIIMRDGE